jgi:hypothetical protein
MRHDLEMSVEWLHFVGSHTVVTGVLVVVLSLAACSSLGGAPDGWRVNSFKDPDTVWAAIELVLLELDYEIVAKHRPDGVIRAEPGAADDGTVIALAIDQVARTDDQVSVYVKPSFVGDGGSVDPDLLKAAADNFVRTLRGKLNR